MEEIEAKFVDIDVPVLREKLTALGAQFIGAYDYKRKNYDTESKFLTKKSAWVRLRDEGERVVMTYKQRFGVEHDAHQGGGVKEIEIVVSDFALADELLRASGFVEKFYEENKRERYILDSVEVDIDTWPMIPPYVELEGSSWKSVQTVAEKLGFDWSKHLRCLTMQIYEMHGINENDYSVITFTEQVKKQVVL